MESYWNDTGKYQTEYTRLFEQLVPASGNCDTLAGELIRSASRIGYDFYNNGFGNNTSGALNFLRTKGAIDEATYSVLYGFTCGLEVYCGKYEGDAAHLAVEAVTNQTIEYILANPELETQFNDEDSFDYEDAYNYYDDEDDLGGWL